MQITTLLSSLDVENNLSVIQSTETVKRLEFNTSLSPALWAHGSQLHWTVPDLEGAALTAGGWAWGGDNHWLPCGEHQDLVLEAPDSLTQGHGDTFWPCKWNTEENGFLGKGEADL